MQDKLERLIKMAYKNWKKDQAKADDMHPDEEALACFLEGRLSKKEAEQIKLHLLSCDTCTEALAVNLKTELVLAKDVPEELLGRVKGMLAGGDKPSILEIVLRCKEKLLELVSTTGDILVGQELVPASVLRSRKMQDFKDEVTILRDFKDIRVEVKVENKAKGAFNLIIKVKQKETQKIIKDLRVTILKDDVELESYLTDLGSVTFEHLLLGSYTIEVVSTEDKLASILLDIKT